MSPLGELRRGVGGLLFVAGAVEQLRPLLGPLFAWSIGGPRHHRPIVPAMIFAILDFLAEQLRGCRSSGCREAAKKYGNIGWTPRLPDARSRSAGGFRAGVARRVRPPISA